MKNDMDKPQKPSNKLELFIDKEKYEWSQDTITGTQIRELASLPEDVEIYLKVPGHPDKPILDTTIVNLADHPGPEHFSSQAAGSKAG